MFRQAELTIHFLGGASESIGLWVYKLGSQRESPGRNSISFIFLGMSEGAPFCHPCRLILPSSILSVISDGSLPKGCPFFNAPGLWWVLPGEPEALPVLLPGRFHLSQGHPGGSQLIETNLFFFPESLYGLRSKTGSEAPHGRKKTQEIEAIMIRAKLWKGREKARDLPIAQSQGDDTLEC